MSYYISITISKAILESNISSEIVLQISNYIFLYLILMVLKYIFLRLVLEGIFNFRLKMMFYFQSILREVYFQVL